MTDPHHRETALLRTRLRLCLYFALAIVLAFAAGDLRLSPEKIPVLYLVKGTFALSIAYALHRLRGSLDRRRTEDLALLMIAAAAATTAISGMIAGDLITTPFLCVTIALTTATIFPWGTSPQIATALLCGLAVIGNAYVVSGSFTLAFGYPTIATGSVFLLSVLIAHEQERQREAAARSELLRAQQSLRESEERFRQIAEGVRDVFWIAERDLSRILYVSPAFEEVVGRGRQRFSRDPREIVRLVHEEDRDALVEAFLAAARAHFHDAPFDREHRIVRPDGSVRWLWTRVFPIRNDQGEVHRIAGTSQDITERKRAEADRAALLQVASDVSGTLDLSEILRRVQQRTAALLPCDAVVTFYWSPARRAMRTIAHHGVPEELRSAVETLEFGLDAPIAERIANARNAVIDDVRRQDWIPVPLLERFGVGSLIAIPLVIRGRVLGAYLVLRSTEQPSFAPAESQLAQGISRHVAVAIETADLYRMQLEETQTAAALAQVGRELITSIDTPELLGRLCQVTAAVLGSQTSHTLMREPDGETFAPVRGYGDTPEQWETIHLLRLPVRLVETLFADLAEDEVLQVDPKSVVREGPVAWALHHYDVQRTLLMPLRVRNEIVGLQTASRLRGDERFAAREERIARGIAQLGSLALQNAQLLDERERSDRIKAHFVAALSHELRNPLGTTIGYSEMLLDGAFGALNEEQADTVRRIHHSAAESLDVIAATLDLSRFEARRESLDVQDVWIDDLFERLSQEPLLQPGDSLRVEWDAAPDIPVLRTDPVKLRMVLKNLVGNAVKFTTDGGVFVSARAVGGELEITVRDTGIGIDPEALRTIFEPFLQAHGTTSRRKGGAGLGLYIVRRLVDILGGHVEAESQPGQGSTFRVTLPLPGDSREGRSQKSEAVPARGGLVPDLPGSRFQVP